MAEMEHEYGLVRARAGMLARRAGMCGRWLDADDLTQRTFERYYEIGMPARVDPVKGSALALLFGVQNYVFLECLRLETRSRRERSLARREHVSPDPVESVLKSEQLACAMRWLCDTSDPALALTGREFDALARVIGNLMTDPKCDTCTPAEQTAVCRARKKLRARARDAGLLDD